MRVCGCVNNKRAGKHTTCVDVSTHDARRFHTREIKYDPATAGTAAQAMAKAEVEAANTLVRQFNCAVLLHQLLLACQPNATLAMHMPTGPAATTMPAQVQ